MTTGTFRVPYPSPPFPCSIDVLFRAPFIRLDGDAIAAVLNRANGVWHEQPNDRLRMRRLDGLARGNYALAFPALAGALHRNPAAAVLPVGTPSIDTIHAYLATCRRDATQE